MRKKKSEKEELFVGETTDLTHCEEREIYDSDVMPF